MWLALAHLNIHHARGLAYWDSNEWVGFSIVFFSVSGNEPQPGRAGKTLASDHGQSIGVGHFNWDQNWSINGSKQLFLLFLIFYSLKTSFSKILGTFVKKSKFINLYISLKLMWSCFNTNFNHFLVTFTSNYLYQRKNKFICPIGYFGLFMRKNKISITF